MNKWYINSEEEKKDPNARNLAKDGSFLLTLPRFFLWFFIFFYFIFLFSLYFLFCSQSFVLFRKSFLNAFIKIRLFTYWILFSTFQSVLIILLAIDTLTKYESVTFLIIHIKFGHFVQCHPSNWDSWKAFLWLGHGKASK